MEEKEYMTKEKYEALTKELETLRKQTRKEIIERIQFAKSLGDLSENAEYHDAREEQAKLEERINVLEELLKRAVIIEKHASAVVELGTTVTVKKKGDGEERTYEILGAEDADMSQGKLSFTSPLGAALLTKKKGDTIQVTTPRGVVEYSVVNVK